MIKLATGLSLLIGMQSALAAGVSTQSIVQQSLSAAPSCLHYRVEGMCFWLKCEGPFCSLDTTLKVSEYLPDTVVSVFNDNTSNPWELVGPMVDQAAMPIAQAQVKSLTGDDYGFGNSSDLQGRANSDERLKEVEAIGNPAAQIFQPPFFIPSATKPFVPYFVSMVDAANWRSGLLEMLYPGSFVPGLHDVGHFPINVWGSLYPRDGFVDSGSDAKAAAVIAQRAASIVTQNGQPHVYYPITGCGDHCQTTAAAENDDNTVQWQMVYPIPDNTCSIFGANDLMQQKPWGGDAEKAGGGNYTWVMWHHYEGCVQGSGDFLGET